MATAQNQPLLVKYHDDSGNVRMSVVRDSNWRRFQTGSEEFSKSDSSDESASDHLHEYARRAGPHDDSDSVNEKYNISDEDGFENADVYGGEENSDESSSEKPVKRNFAHPYAHDYVGSDSNDSGSDEKQKHVKPCQAEKSSKRTKKIVYVYKQPPIIVRPKPTNVYIKSKPIVVQPPPLVVHHPQPKPCNPIIKYQPPNIKLRPVIVKISKPKKTTTTTKPCPTTTTTKRPCRKCRRKPTKKCGRCSRRKHSKSHRPEVYFNQHYYRDAVLT